MIGTRTTAVITGASSGIGMEMASLFAADGYDLILTARRLDRLQKLADDFLLGFLQFSVLAYVVRVGQVRLRKAIHECEK